MQSAIAGACERVFDGREMSSTTSIQEMVVRAMFSELRDLV